MRACSSVPARLVLGFAGLVLCTQVWANLIWLGNDIENNTILQTTTTGTVLQTVTVGGNTGIAIDHATNTLFLSSRTGAIQTRDLSTLAVTGSVPHPQGNLSTIYEDLAWDGTFLYRGDFTNDRVFRVDRTTGMQTEFVTGFDGAVGVAFDSSDNTFWVASFNLGQLRHYSAAGTQIGAAINPADLPTQLGGLAYDPADETLYIGGRERVWHITKTGALLNSFTTSAPRFIDGLELQITALDLPEPAPLALLAIGLAGIAFGRRKAGR